MQVVVLILCYGQVLLGGGQDAASVTTTAAAAGGFEARFFHKASPIQFAPFSHHSLIFQGKLYCYIIPNCSVFYIISRPPEMLCSFKSRSAHFLCYVHPAILYLPGNQLHLLNSVIETFLGACSLVKIHTKVLCNSGLVVQLYL